MGLVPLDTLIERHSGAAKDIQGTSDSQVDLALAADMNFLQILQASGTTSIGNGNGAPFGQFGYQLLVDTLLQALHIRSMNQKFRTVGLQ